MKELKLLIGGSPCTFWSIAQTKHRETKPSGMGWELFLNYLIAKEKFKPDLFLYENNVSADPSIKEEIKKDLGVDDFALLRGEESPASYVEINSALVSAQSRKRFYVHNCGEDLPMPKDRGILLKDILETGGNMSYPVNGSENEEGKARSLKASYGRTGPANMLREHGFEATGVAEEIPDGKADTVTTSQPGKVFEPICVNSQSGDFGGSFAGVAKTFRKQYEKGEVKFGFNEHKTLQPRPDGKTNTLTTVLKDNTIAEPMPVKENTLAGETRIEPGEVVDLANENSKTRRGRKRADKCHALLTDNTYYQYLGTKERPVYEVKDGQIEIKGKKHPIRLKDGKYIIRKLSVTECERLQTMPDGYVKALPASKAYKALGNGWTAEVVIHILGWGLRNVPRDTKIKALSMYDGIATGRYVLDRLGFKDVEYHAYEIDKDPIKVALDNYPDIMEHGDAFQVRKEDWKI